MTRGGKRPGAGAPKGNINALKHGRRSRRLNEFGAQLAASPSVRRILLRLADQEKMQAQEADRIAAHIIEQVLARGLKRGRERLIVLPPLNDGPTTNKTCTKRGLSQRDKGRKLLTAMIECSVAGQQTPRGRAPKARPLRSAAAY